jgi:DNA-nicking Smr family endonuclease
MGATPAAPETPDPPPASEADLFASAMEGVQALDARERERVDAIEPSRLVPRALTDEDAEVLTALAELVDGETHFDLTDTAEYVEGAVAGLDPRVVRRLRRGEFAWQAFLDLHGFTVAEARPAVVRFVREALRAGHRCLLVVHGRGHNSKDGEPVLKRRVVGWLARGALGRVVLAFATARPSDGGAGALYVLLRRDRSQRPIRVTGSTG